MSNKTNLSIEILSVKLLYRIFDNLDAEIILFSIRPLSKFFQSIVNTYDRFDLNFNLISKPIFHNICRLINPKNVISLTLSNDDRTLNQIDLFISRFNLKQFSRLRSLTLFNIDENQLNIILERFNLNTLESLSLNIRKYDDQYRKTTISLLTAVISNSNLHKLDFDIIFGRIPKSLWPINYTIQYLTINNYINIDDLCRIFQCSPYLHTLIMKDIPQGMINNLSSIRFRQLRSLTIKDLKTTIDELESFLLLTPLLIHLILIGGENMLNGKRWEQFIQLNLSQLNKFEFYFTESRFINPSLTDLELILTSFQTPFWIQHKKWFVTCECHRTYPYNIYLYSLPICKSSICYVPKSKKVSLTTCPLMMNNDLPMMNNIKSLNLTLDKSLDDEVQKKMTTNHPLVPKAVEIQVNFCKDYPLLSLKSLSMFIDMSRIVQMKIFNNYMKKYNSNIWIDICNIFKQIPNLSSLIIDSNFRKHHSGRMTKKIYSILPHHVKHLEIPIDDLNQIKIILEQCVNLSTIKFDINNKELSKQIVSWFDDNTINTICQETYRTVSVWLGKKNLQRNEIRSNPSTVKFYLKRINKFSRNNFMN